MLESDKTDKADLNKDDTKYITIYSRGSGFHKKQEEYYYDANFD